MSGAKFLLKAIHTSRSLNTLFGLSRLLIKLLDIEVGDNFQNIKSSQMHHVAA